MSKMGVWMVGWHKGKMLDLGGFPTKRRGGTSLESLFSLSLFMLFVNW